MSLVAMVHYFSSIDDHEAYRRHKARQKPPRAVTFSEEGVWEAGTFFPLNRQWFVADLKTVRLTYQPSVLHFDLQTYTEDGDPKTVVTLHVLVPGGQEGEAGLLLERFQTEVIQKRKQEAERYRNAQKEQKRQKRERKKKGQKFDS